MPWACPSRTSTARLRPAPSPESPGGCRTGAPWVPSTPGSRSEAGRPGRDHCVRHAGTFLGYQQRSGRHRRCAGDGWVCTGDRCEIKDGDLVFVDRLEDLITLPLRRRDRAPGDREPAQVQPLHPGRLGLRRATVRLPLGGRHHRSGQHRPLGRQAQGELHDVRRPRAETRGIPAHRTGDRARQPRADERPADRPVRQPAQGIRRRRGWNSLATASCAGLFCLKGIRIWPRLWRATRRAWRSKQKFTYQDGRTGRVKTAVRIATNRAG